MIATTIAVDSFLRIPYLQLSPKAPVVLIGAGNEQGKSSFAEAIRFAMLDDSPRVRLKKDRDQLVHSGSKNGKVTIESGNLLMTRAIRGGAIEGDAGLIPADLDVAAICLQAKCLTGLPDAERRSLLMRLAKIDLSVDSLAGKLIEKGVDKNAVAALRPLLKGGLKPAHDKAKREVSDARGAWRECTGEVYGSQKADGWKPAEPVIASDAAAQSLVDIDTQMAELRSERDAALAGAITEIETEIGTERESKESALAPILASIRGYNDQLSRPTPLACPHCGGVVSYEDGNLKQAEPADKARVTKMLSIANLKRKEISDKHDAKLKALSDRRAETTRKISGEYDDNLSALSEDKSVLVEQVTSSERAIERQHRAAELHKSVKTHTRLTELLSDGPEGIAAEMVGAALKPLNDRLIEIGQEIGWTPVAIHGDMSIVRTDGFGYNLLSESAKWRADAMLHILVSELSGFDMLVLDRMDVLEVSHRGQFLQWVNDYAEVRADNPIQIFVMATLKQPPDLSALPMIDSYWIEDGRLS
jgi:hypothetical protein